MNFHSQLLDKQGQTPEQGVEDAYLSSLGPRRGFWPQNPGRLMWSRISMISPTSNLGLSPPAALVTTKVSTPRRWKTLTGNVTFDSEYPSYMWNRPCIITQDLPFRNPNTRRPAWPCTSYRKGKKSKVIGTCFFSQYSGGRSRRVCQFKASLDYIASSRPARDTR